MLANYHASILILLCKDETGYKNLIKMVSAGFVDGIALLDLDYPEDSHAEVDLNLVGTGDGRIVEVQGTGERATIDRAQLDELLDLSQAGIALLARLQSEVTGYRL